MLQMMADLVMEQIEIRLKARKVVREYNSRIQRMNKMNTD